MTTDQKIIAAFVGCAVSAGFYFIFRIWRMTGRS
jgi:hypothetical protein